MAFDVVSVNVGITSDMPALPGFALDIAPGSATFPDGGRAPQFGWNKVTAQAGCRLLQDGYAYFANSYRVRAVPDGWHAATADHGGPFVAAMERGAVLACQFHPELSGRYGIELLRRWIGGAAC